MQIFVVYEANLATFSHIEKSQGGIYISNYPLPLVELRNRTNYLRLLLGRLEQERSLQEMTEKIIFNMSMQIFGKSKKFA